MIDFKSILKNAIGRQTEEKEEFADRTNDFRKKFGNLQIFTKTSQEGAESKIKLYIGLDVGTSSTKVVIREPEKNVVYLVDFQEYGIEGQTYLLPTTLSKDGNNNLCLCRYNQTPFYTDLKLKYLEWLKKDDADRKKDQTAHSLFLAYVVKTLEYVRDWFMLKYGKSGDIVNKEIVWHLNMGVPSATYDSPTNDEYQEIAVSAYKQVFPEQKDSLVADTEDPLVVNIPEIIASAQSYFSNRKETRLGMRFVCDIGAGTIDMCMFYVTPFQKKDVNGIYHNVPGEYNYSFLADSVELLGTTMYMDILSACVTDEKQKEEMKRNFVSKFVVPSVATDMKQYYSKLLEQYKAKIKYQIKSTVKTAHKRGGYSHAQGEGFNSWVPLILVGGGSAISLYKDNVTSVSNILLENEGRDTERFRGFNMLDMAIPVNYTTSVKRSEIDNHRLLVALGLSYPKDGYRVHLPKDMERQNPKLPKEKNSREDGTGVWG